MKHRRRRWRIPLVLTPRGEPDLLLMVQALWDAIRNKISKKHAQSRDTEPDQDTNGDTPDGGDSVV